jgi:protein-tyrosine phosphatase
MDVQVIDLHSHILPSLDDGSSSLETSLHMAVIAVDDGVEFMACTPHIKSGVYENSRIIIETSLYLLRTALARHDIPLKLCAGADIHVTPSLAVLLKAGILPTLGGSRYFLFEPPHNVVVPGLLSLTRAILADGFVPILTHPERLTWIENHYDLICDMDEAGVGIQLTAASVLGKFGKRAAYWSERMLDEGRVDLLASDAHDVSHRPPGLSHARDRVAQRYDEMTARLLTELNGRAILEDKPLAEKRRQPRKAAIGTRNRPFIPWPRRER